MSFIATFTKKIFDPLNPNIDDIDIVDISHSLSYLCRANGHFKSFYSVGQHSINCMKEAAARGYSRRVQLACLLHDASEAYLSDVTRPVKAELPKYLEIEKPLQDTIWRKWCPGLTEEEEKLVFEIDDAVLYFEFIALMERTLTMPEQQLVSKPRFDCLPFLQVEEEFRKLFYELV